MLYVSCWFTVIRNNLSSTNTLSLWSDILFWLCPIFFWVMMSCSIDKHQESNSTCHSLNVANEFVIHVYCSWDLEWYHYALCKLLVYCYSEQPFVNQHALSLEWHPVLALSYFLLSHDELLNRQTSRKQFHIFAFNLSLLVNLVSTYLEFQENKSAVVSCILRILIEYFLCDPEWFSDVLDF